PRFPATHEILAWRLVLSGRQPSVVRYRHQSILTPESADPADYSHNTPRLRGQNLHRGAGDRPAARRSAVEVFGRFALTDPAAILWQRHEDVFPNCQDSSDACSLCYQSALSTDYSRFRLFASALVPDNLPANEMGSQKLANCHGIQTKPFQIPPSQYFVLIKSQMLFVPVQLQAMFRCNKAPHQ